MPKIYSYDLKMSVINFRKSCDWNLDNAVKIFGASKSSIYGWIKMYSNDLLIRNSNVRTFYESKITDEIKKYVVSYVTKRVTFNVKKLNRCIKNNFNMTLCKSSIYNILKQNNMSYKKIGKKIIPINKNIDEQIKNLKEEVKKYKSDKVVSIDESSFDIQICSKYGWSKKGETIKKIIKTTDRKRKTLTLAITKNRIVGYNIVNGSSNGNNFCNFLKNDILPHIENGIILMDNVRFHHSKIVTDAINTTTNKIIYNVAYNPDTNPIEFCFSPIKNIVSNKNITNEDQLINEIKKSLKILTVSKLEAFFKHSLGI
jgi:transposase